MPVKVNVFVSKLKLCEFYGAEHVNETCTSSTFGGINTNDDRGFSLSL